MYHAKYRNYQMLLAGRPRSKRRGNYVAVHVDGVTLCLRNAATNGPVAHPSGDIYEYGEARWNDTDRENRRTRSKTCPSATFAHRQMCVHACVTNYSDNLIIIIIIIIIIIRGATALTNLGRQSSPTAPDGTGLTCGQHIESHSCIFSFPNRTVISLFK
jgi:hypothetical protein